ncbi:MAG: VOC family protein [Oscillospiraceae bacterium]
MVQIGIVVRDIDRTLETLKAVFGWEAYAFADTPEGEKLYYGEVEDFSVRMAFVRFEHIEIELLQPTRGRNVWQDYLDTHGEGLHHILFDVNDFERAKAALEAQGIMMVQTGPSARYPGARWAYFDAMQQLGYYIECFNPSEFGYDSMALAH